MDCHSNEIHKIKCQVNKKMIPQNLFMRLSLYSPTEGGDSALDPGDHLFRVRLVCVVLETCGTYFDKGSSKRKLDCFLIYFQVLISI